MNKYCYICGKPILKGDYYYNIGGNSFVCENKECYNKYYWDNLAARMATDLYHEYVIVDKNVYEIGSDDDQPRGFSGRHWIIQFNDGFRAETNSLWHRGELPLRLQHDFPDNAKFIEG